MHFSKRFVQRAYIKISNKRQLGKFGSNQASLPQLIWPHRSGQVRSIPQLNSSSTNSHLTDVTSSSTTSQWGCCRRVTTTTMGILRFSLTTRTPRATLSSICPVLRISRDPSNSSRTNQERLANTYYYGSTLESDSWDNPRAVNTGECLAGCANPSLTIHIMQKLLWVKRVNTVKCLKAALTVGEGTLRWSWGKDRGSSRWR